MLPVHDHSARASTRNVAAIGLATLLRPCEASGSGPVDWPSIADHEPSQGLLPRFAA